MFQNGSLPLCLLQGPWIVNTWKVKKSVSCSVVSNSLRPHGLQPSRLLCPWDFPGKSTGVGCHSLLRIGSLFCSNPDSVTCCWTSHQISLNICFSSKNYRKTARPIVSVYFFIVINIYSCCSAAQLCRILWGPMDCSTLGFLPCLSQSSGVSSNSYPLSLWCYLTISSSVVPFSSCRQSFPASGSFLMVRSLYQVAKVLELQLQYQFFQWIFRTDFL